MTSPTVEEALKACPLCRGDHVVSWGPGRGGFVTCDHCGCSLERTTLAEAITAWNTRLLPIEAQGGERPVDPRWAGRFSVHDPDPTDDHSAIYLVCPGGLMVDFSSDPTPGLDVARVTWIADALNAALARPDPSLGGREDKHEAEIGKLIDERDAAEEALGQAYYLITGRSPAWSSMWGHAECLEEIGDAQHLLRLSAAPQSLLRAALKPFADACPANDRIPDQDFVSLKHDGLLLTALHVADFRKAHEALSALSPPSLGMEGVREALVKERARWDHQSEVWEHAVRKGNAPVRSGIRMRHADEVVRMLDALIASITPSGTV